MRYIKRARLAANVLSAALLTSLFGIAATPAAAATCASLPDYGTPELEIVALYPHRRQLSTKVRLFLDRLIDLFAEERRWFDATPDR